MKQRHAMAASLVAAAALALTGCNQSGDSGVFGGDRAGRQGVAQQSSSSLPGAGGASNAAGMGGSSSAGRQAAAPGADTGSGSAAGSTSGTVQIPELGLSVDGTSRPSGTDSLGKEYKIEPAKGEAAWGEVVSALKQQGYTTGLERDKGDGIKDWSGTKDGHEVMVVSTSFGGKVRLTIKILNA